jgi:cobalt-zinc-cadmium resistance protein CzcA
LPAAISTGIGSQVQRPLATVVVGGMLIGPVIMLVVVPALQTLVLDWTERRRREVTFREDEPDLAET